jgi:hypothetical protein
MSGTAGASSLTTASRLNWVHVILVFDLMSAMESRFNHATPAAPVSFPVRFEITSLAEKSFPEGVDVPVANVDILAITAKSRFDVPFIIASFHGDTNGLVTKPSSRRGCEGDGLGQHACQPHAHSWNGCQHPQKC